MLYNLVKSCAVIAGIAITTMATTGHAKVFGPNGQSVSDVPPPSRTQSAPNARSFGSSHDGPFIPQGSVAANSPVYGKTYGEWGGEWSKWAFSFPDGMNPVQDETGELCDLGQSGPVWFLAGTFGASVTEAERHCTIPSGKAIFYPLVNATWIDVPGDEIFTDEEVRWIVASLVGDLYCQMTSTLDTFTTPNLGEVSAPISARLRNAVRAQSPKFRLNLPEGAIGGFPPGENERLITGGYWVMLPPLTPGEHVLTLHGAQCSENDEGVIEKVFETEVTYHLTVVRGK
jgi:hypothetical protein